MGINVTNYFKILSDRWFYLMSTEKRYLVYKSWNGQVHTSIEYGELTDGEGKQKNNSEIKRFEILHNTNDLKSLKALYPLEEVKNEAPVNS